VISPDGTETPLEVLSVTNKSVKKAEDKTPIVGKLKYIGKPKKEKSFWNDYYSAMKLLPQIVNYDELVSSTAPSRTNSRASFVTTPTRTSSRLSFVVTTPTRTDSRPDLSK
jgi:hypothetical protein